MKSWQKRVIALLTAILVAVGIFFGWTTYNYSSAIRSSIREENTVSVRLWSNLLETRTGAVNEHITELMFILYNRTKLDFGTPPMDIHTQVAAVDAMSDKLFISDQADAFFIIDEQNDIYLFSARSSLPYAETIQLKSFVRSDAVARARPFGEKVWDLVEVNGTDYFFKSVQLGKYTAGAISGCSHYRIENSFHVLGEEFGLFLRTGEGLFPCGGDPLLARELEEDFPAGDRGGWVTVTAPAPFLDGEIILLARPGAMPGAGDQLPLFLFLDSVVCVVLILLLLFLLRRDVVLPTRELVSANQALASGQIEYRLSPEAAGSLEFRTLYESFNSMADQIVKLRIDAYDMKLKDEENRLTMLRAQIKPHSLLNVITTISNMTYTSRPEEIRAYISAFARFVRYMLNTSSPWTTVDEELRHISNYLEMQRTRFPGSLRYTAERDEETAARPIPFLILFTLVENSIKHAMTLYEPLDIHITCRRITDSGFSGVSLTVEDSGGGFSQEALEKLREESAPYAKEHLGLSNVRYTLNLIYRRDDLLRVENRPEGGARVEIRIPDKEETP